MNLTESSPDIQYAFFRIACGLFCFFCAAAAMKKSFALKPATQVSFVCLSLGWWNLIFGLGQAANDVGLTIFLEPLKYLGVILSPLALCYYAYTYADFENKTAMKIMAVIPAVSCAFALLSYRYPFLIDLSRPKIINDTFRSVIFPYGFWFVIHAVYSYLLILVTLVFFLIKSFSRKTKNRPALYVMIAVITCYLIFNMFYTISFTDGLIIKILSVILQFSLVTSFFCTFYFDPNENTVFLGHKNFFETMGLPVLLFNKNNELIFYNAKAEQFAGFQPEGLSKYETYDDVFSKKRFTMLLQKNGGFFLSDRRSAAVYYCGKRTVKKGEKKAGGYLYSLYELKSMHAVLANLEQKLYFDSVWNCYNRVFYEKTTENLPQSLPKPFAFLIADVDNLKSVNDTFGHPAGNDCIKECLRILRLSIRKKDQLFKIGGDEFALLLPDTNEATVKTIAERIEKEAAALRCEHFWGISTGYAVCTENVPFETLFNAADKMMYDAKQQKKTTRRVSLPPS